MYHHIMVPLDGSDLGESVLSHVQAVARGCNVSKVTLVRVVEPLHSDAGVESRLSTEDRSRFEDKRMDIARNYLHQLLKQLKDNGIMA